MTRQTTDKLIEVIINGAFVDVEKTIRPYRVKIEMPDCIDEWLLSNIKTRYALQTLRKGKEYQNQNTNQTTNQTEKDKENTKEKSSGNKNEIENKSYLNASRVITVNIEEIDENGNNLIKITNKLPSFYNKSIFNFSYLQLQDFSVAFGLHEIKTGGESIETMRMNAFLEYLNKVKGIDENKIKQFSFYKYDKVYKRAFYCRYGVLASPPLIEPNAPHTPKDDSPPATVVVVVAVIVP